MNDVGVVDGDSGDIYDKFFGIYDPRKVFTVEFFAWLLAQGIESDFNDDQCTNNFFSELTNCKTMNVGDHIKKSLTKLV
ncbi:29553_t:CDS:1, partial [Racocetra persica]